LADKLVNDEKRSSEILVDKEENLFRGNVLEKFIHGLFVTCFSETEGNAS